MVVESNHEGRICVARSKGIISIIVMLAKDIL